MTIEHGEMESYWTREELVAATGGNLVFDGEIGENYGQVVFPLQFVKSRSILIHTDGSWSDRGKRDSRQTDKTLDEVIEIAQQHGAALVIATERTKSPSPLPILRVENTYEAFFALAHASRARFSGHVIGVTGTAGKSSTRDILVQLLSRVGNTTTSFGNWNSVAGVTMCIANLRRDAAFAVVEIGGQGLPTFNKPKADFVRPHDGIITSIGINDTAYSPTPTATANLKSLLFSMLPPSGCAYWPENVAEEPILRAAAEGKRNRIVGDPSCTTITIEHISSGVDWLRVKVSTEDFVREVNTRIIGPGPLSNIKLAAQCALDLGVPAETIADVIENFSLPAKKMEIIHTNFSQKRVTVLDDCWNATLISFENVLSHIAKIHDKRRILIIGRIVRIEGAEQHIYSELAKLICDCNPFAVILHEGELQLLAKELAGKVPLVWAKSPSDAVDLVESLVDDGSVVLLKGSHRTTRIWGVSKLLKERSGVEPRVDVSPTAAVAPDLESATSIVLADPHRITREVSGELIVGILGDTYLGESYLEKARSSRSNHPLSSADYDGSFEHLDDFLRANDVNVVNFEAPMTTAAVSPFAGLRPNLHWARPDETLACLARHNIHVVSLANDHLCDFGPDGILATLEACSVSSLIAIGAGQSASEATRPLAIEAQALAPDSNSESSRQVILLAGLPYRRNVEKKFGAYARNGHPGCLAFHETALADTIRRARDNNPHSYIVVAPHWQREYRWVSSGQRNLAAAAFEAGADLVIGHGAKMLQQVERFGQCVAVHGIGNFVFNARGSYKSKFAPGVSAAARLVLPMRSDESPVLRLYPLLCDNRTTNFRPRFLTETDAPPFMETYLKLGFLPPDARSMSDETGYFIELRLAQTQENR